MFKALRGVALALVAIPSVASAGVIYESTLLGLPVPSGTGFVVSGDSAGVGTGQWVGVRFELDSPADVQSIGAHLVGRGTGNGLVFAAVVGLSGPTDLPDSIDLSTPDVLGAALLWPDEMVSGEIDANLSLDLAPGWYAIVVGTGFPGAPVFSATGSGNLPGNNQQSGGPQSYIFRNAATSGSWDVDIAPPLLDVRLFLDDEPAASGGPRLISDRNVALLRFDLTSELGFRPPPYEALTLQFDFGLGDLMDVGEGYQILDIYAGDGSGSLLSALGRSTILNSGVLPTPGSTIEMTPIQFSRQIGVSGWVLIRPTPGSTLGLLAASVSADQVGSSLRTRLVDTPFSVPEPGPTFGLFVGAALIQMSYRVRRASSRGLSAE